MVGAVVRLAAVTLCLSAAAIAAHVEPAGACSCISPIDARSALHRADAAFVGSLLERRQGARFDEAIYVFRVEVVVKGKLDETVEVMSGSSGANCGLSATPRGVGLLLYRRDGTWSSGLCSQFPPDELLAAARPLPRPNGRGPLTLLVGGQFGEVRTIGLDTRGRTLAYGRGGGATILFSACPGSRRIAEVATTGRGHVLAVRDRRLRIVRTRPLPSGWPQALACRAADGSEVLVFFPGAERRASIWRLGRNKRAAIWRGPASAAIAVFGANHAYVGADDRLFAVDLSTGRSRTLLRLRPPKLLGTLALSPDGRMLAGITGEPLERRGMAFRLVVIRLGARSTLRTAPLTHPDDNADVVWWRPTRVVFLPKWNRGAVRVFDTSPRVRKRFGLWPAGNSIVVGGRALGHLRGDVFAMRLSDGGVTRVRRLPGRATHVIAGASAPHS